MERDLKQLYRQRGSALRRINRSVVIEDQNEQRSESNIDMMKPMYTTMDEPILNFTLDRSETEQAVVDEKEYKELGDIDGVGYRNEGDELDSMDHLFDGLSLTKLSASITTMAVIEVFGTVVQRLFGHHLLEQSKQYFYSAQGRQDRLSYKMDIKIFERFAEFISSDLKDILDIHLSNNEICYRLKQILRTKQDLTEQLLQARERLAHLDKVQLQETQKKHELESLIDLNKKLHNLSNVELDDSNS